MRALLDEQLSPQTAVLLRQAGYDADAVADREDLTGRSGRIIFEVACSEGRALVTNNIRDFRPLLSGSSAVKAAIRTDSGAGIWSNSASRSECSTGRSATNDTFYLFLLRLDGCPASGLAGRLCAA